MSHPQWFLNEGDDHLQSYLAHVKEADSGLYRRIIELLSESPDCCVCMENQTDTVFQCGHGTCGECSGRLERCPLCRDYIQSRSEASSLSQQQRDIEEQAQAAAAKHEQKIMT